MRVHLVTAESPESQRLRRARLIQFPQLTMPLVAALTPSEHTVSHTDEIVDRVRFDVPADLVGITAPTPSALHAYALAGEFRRRGVPVVIGGPHATALPEEAARHADAVVVGEAEDTWPRVLDDARRGTLESMLPMPGTPTFHRMNAAGRILTTDWSKYDGKKHCVFEPALMSPAALEAGTDWVARRFYSPRSIVRRLSGSRAGLWWNLPRNVGYMLAN